MDWTDKEAEACWVFRTSILLVLLPKLRCKSPLSKYVDILEYDTKETDYRVNCRAI